MFEQREVGTEVASHRDKLLLCRPSLRATPPSCSNTTQNNAGTINTVGSVAVGGWNSSRRFIRLAARTRLNLEDVFFLFLLHKKAE